jgi:hypothetical protein
MGHVEALTLPTLNAGFELSNPTFAGPHSTYRIAPIAGDLQTTRKPTAPTVAHWYGAAL